MKGDLVKIPFFSLQRKWQTHGTEYLAIIKNVFESQEFIGGKYITSFEETLSSHVNDATVVSCNSGTDGLWMALSALNISPGNIVITTPFSFIASSSEIVAHGGIPLFIDIDEQTYNLSPHNIETWLKKECTIINDQTIHTRSRLPVVGILSVDLFGQLADYTALQQIAKAWHLWIIEDACQSIEADIDQKKAGTFGDIGVFSFYPTKNLGAFGDGGAVVTHNPRHALNLKQLKNHGRSSHYHYQLLGINSRLDTIQAALLIKRLQELKYDIAARKAHAKQYLEGLKNIPEIILPQEIIGTHTFHQFSIRLAPPATEADRTLLVEMLAQKGIETRIFYPEPLNTIPFLHVHSVQNQACPVAYAVSKSIIALPIWPELTKSEIDYIIHAIINAVEIIKKPKQTFIIEKTI
jgi:dTDP-4-amino-4,6-dideoxygalactose transaminase